MGPRGPHSVMDLLEGRLSTLPARATSRPARPRARERLLRRFVNHAGIFTGTGVTDEFILNLLSPRSVAYQIHLEVFCDVVADSADERDSICTQGCGHSPRRDRARTGWAVATE